MGLTRLLTQAHREKIRAGVKRTITLRRKRRTNAQIQADPTDRKRVDFTKESGKTNGRTRVRDLRSQNTPEEKQQGIYFFDVGRYLSGDKLRQHLAEQHTLSSLTRRPALRILANPLDRHHGI